MFGHHFHTRLIIVNMILSALWGSFASLSVVGQEAAPEYVLLDTGQLLHGVVSVSGKSVQVKLHSGITLTVGSNEVELRCHSAESAFAHLQRNSRADSLHQQIVLTRWCIKNDLLELAERQLLVLSRLGIGEQSRRQIRNEIDFSRASKVRSTTADAQQHVQNQSSPVASQQRKKKLSNRELNKLVKSLPDGSFLDFTRNIQGPLIRGCAATACHDHDAPELALNFLRVGHDVPRKTSQRNLRQVLDHVNMSEPGASEVYRRAITAHGNALTAPWSEDSIPAQRLKRWLYRVANRPLPSSRPGIAGANSSQNSPPIDPNLFKLPSIQTAGIDPTEQHAAALPEIQPPITAGELPGLESTDPFDPEVFNRKYRTTRKPGTEEQGRHRR